MTRTTALATIAMLVPLAAGPAFAQTTTDEDTDVIVVEPEQDADVEVVEPEAETDVEVVEDPAMETDTAEPMQDMANLIRTRDITGGPVYSTGEDYYDEARWTATDPFDAARTGAYEPYGYDENYDNIGEIEDVILDSSGQMIGIVAEVGGFLDIGDHHVMLPVEDVRLVPVDDTSYAFVTRYTEEQLEELPSVDEGPLN